MLSVIMLNVANKPFMMSVVMLNVVTPLALPEIISLAYFLDECVTKKKSFFDDGKTGRIR
jgi:hypothetical protein